MPSSEKPGAGNGDVLMPGERAGLAQERGAGKPAIFFALVAVAALLLYAFLIPLFTPQGFYQEGGFQPGLSFALIVFVVFIINPFWRRLTARGGISAPALTLTFALTFAAGSLASASMAQYFYPLVIQIVYKASPQNRWDEFLKYIPDRLLPSRDPNSIVVAHFWEGLRKGEHIPWGAWIVPLAAWTIFFALLFLLLFCLAVIIRRQLVERELLDFPMMRPALEVLRRSDPEQPSLTRGKAFWIAFAFMCFLSTIEPGNLPQFGAKIPVVGPFFAEIPRFLPISYVKVSGNIFGYKPWNALNRTVFLWIPSFIALFYLLPAEASFSVWFFYVLTNKLIPVIAAASGFTLKQPGGNQDYSYLRDLTKGGLVVFICMFLWNARGHLRSVLKKAFRIDPSVDDSDEVVPYRFAVFGAAAGLLGLIAWCVWNGMAWYYAAIFLGLMLVMMTYFAKQSGEMTLPYANFNYYPQDYMNTVIGASAVAKANLVMGHLLQMVVMFSPPVLLANFVQGFKIAGEMRLRKRLLAPCLLAAFVIGIALTHFAFIGLAYHKGIGVNIRHDHRVYMEAFGNQLTQELNAKEGPEPLGIAWMAIGGVTMAAIMLLRQSFVWWPLGPVGLIASSFSWVFQTWFMFFIAWALKLAVIKLGGPKTYVKSLPIVFGLMVGGAVIGTIWGIVRIIYENFLV